MTTISILAIVELQPADPDSVPAAQGHHRALTSDTADNLSAELRGRTV